MRDVKRGELPGPIFLVELIGWIDQEWSSFYFLEYGRDRLRR